MYVCSYKARPQQLYLPKRFHSKLAPLPNAGAMGTNAAFIGKFDGRGQSTKVLLVTAVRDLSSSVVVFNVFFVPLWRLCAQRGKFDWHSFLEMILRDG
jgi:hypothetical protein